MDDTESTQLSSRQIVPPGRIEDENGPLIPRAEIELYAPFFDNNLEDPEEEARFIQQYFDQDHRWVATTAASRAAAARTNLINMPLCLPTYNDFLIFLGWALFLLGLFVFLNWLKDIFIAEVLGPEPFSSAKYYRYCHNSPCRQ